MEEGQEGFTENRLLKAVGEERQKNLKKNLVYSLIGMLAIFLFIAVFSFYLFFERSGRYFSKAIFLILLDVVFIGIFLFRRLSQYQAENGLSIEALGAKYSGVSLLVKGNAKKQEKNALISYSVSGSLLLLMAVIFTFLAPSSYPDLTTATLVSEHGVLADAPSYVSKDGSYIFSLTGDSKTYTITSVFLGEMDRQAFKNNVVAGSVVTFSHLESKDVVYAFASDNTAYLTVSQSIQAIHFDQLTGYLFAGVFALGGLLCFAYEAIRVPYLKKKEKDGVYEPSYLHKDEMPFPKQGVSASLEKERFYRYKKGWFIFAWVFLGLSIALAIAGLICIPFALEGAIAMSLSGVLIGLLCGFLLFSLFHTMIKTEAQRITFYLPFRKPRSFAYEQLDVVQVTNGGLIVYTKEGKIAGSLDLQYQDFSALCVFLIDKGIRFPRELFLPK